MRKRLVAVLAVLALAVAACGNSDSDDDAEGGGGGDGGGGDAAVSVDQPGVTDSAIRVGGVVGTTNPLGLPYDNSCNGVRAYFDYVNETEGGVFGRDLELVECLDDQTTKSKNQQQARKLVEETGVFAVLPVTTSTFGAAKYLAEEGVPTFGWNIQEEWSGPPNLFGERGSFICAGCTDPDVPYAAQQLGFDKVAVLSYTAPQSKQCADGNIESFQRYGFDVAFQDTSLAYGFTDISADVQRIKDSGARFIATCMDVNGNIRLAEGLRNAGVEGFAIYAPQGYDQEFVAEFADELGGFYFAVPFTPFEFEDQNEGLALMREWVEKGGYDVNEFALVGWSLASMFVEGLKQAGEDFTRESVVDAVNQITDWTAGGIYPPIDWTKAHSEQWPTACTAWVKVEGGSFVPVFGTDTEPFVCVGGKDVETLPDPAPTLAANDPSTWDKVFEALGG
ncbi:MAG: ABC transporter substrate-binding protein [Acidimicrobiia bacterium]|nr:ABC transporter substrate-binding protein [Acidimicrobiia bacterium]